MEIGLFSGVRELRAVLDWAPQTVWQHLARWDEEAFLNTSEHDAIETLLNTASVNCPRLRHDEAWIAEPTRADGLANEWSYARGRYLSIFYLIVPFEGDREVFTYRLAGYPKGSVGRGHPNIDDLGSAHLRLTVRGVLTDASQVRAEFDRQLDWIERWLDLAREQIGPHNAKLRETVSKLVARRRADLLGVRNMYAAIGFPIRSRPDEAALGAPVQQRPMAPSAPTPDRPATPFAPEPTLTDDDYEAALHVLHHSRNALERTPSVAAGMDEESIRNLLLVSLNAQFEGSANGEVFNGNGKTDILVRGRDRNVFIGECKIWAGPRTVEAALDQLLSYLVWRDTKGALLIFIRNKDVSAAIRSAVETIEAHPNCKRRGLHDSEERIDFVMHAQGDRDREIHLALLPFALPGDATSRFKH